jgi:RNA 3'-terminal phosphate cyclase (ATP)
MIEIDGAIGGGSVLRVAAGLAIATNQAIRIINIRQQRRKPGLQAQHVAGLRAAAAYCDGQLAGGEIGATQIEFTPGATRREKLDLQIETAGSIGLALQPLLIASLAASDPLIVNITGGATFGQWAPPVPYLDRVFAPMLERWGRGLSMHVDRHGFYPQGGARVTAKLRSRDLRSGDISDFRLKPGLQPQTPQPLMPGFVVPALAGSDHPSETSTRVIESRGKLLRVKGISIAANHLKEARVALRQAQAATNALLIERLGVRVDVRPDDADTRSPGSGIVLWAEYENCVLGASALGAPGKRSELVGEEAAEALLAEIRADGTVDRHMADQLIPVVALLGDKFRAPEMTEHVNANLAVVEQMLGKRLSVEDRWICCDGVLE